MNRWRFVSFFISLSIFVGFLNDYATAQLSEEQIKAFRSAKTVRIVVNQLEGINLPFEHVAQGLLEYAGLKVVKADAKEYDVTLKIHAEGVALGAYYYDRVTYSRTFRYTGASLSGKILLEISGILVYKKSFKGYIEPSPSIFVSSLGDFKLPSSGPFYLAFRKSSFVQQMFEMMRDVYDFNFLLGALKDENSNVQKYAVEALGEIKDTRTVEPLIAIIKDEDEDSNVRMYAAEALGEIGDARAVEALIASLNDEAWGVYHSSTEALGKIKDPRAIEPLLSILKKSGSSIAAKALGKITGKGFGIDPDNWLKWWEQNKESFQNGR